MAKSSPEEKPNQQLTKTDHFAQITSELERRAWAELPPHVSKDRFVAAAMAAIKQTPDLLQCTPRSLMASITKAAQDGLLPDGREGVITKYKDQAQWNPMAFGLRKRARELDGIIVDAQAFYENDTDGAGIIWDQGDDPKIIHRPKLGDRGKLFGAYAIFRKDGEILFREVMDRDQIEKTRGQSSFKDSLMWVKFTEEAYRKTVVRRGFKSVPCSASLERVVTRNDDEFDFSQENVTPITRAPVRTVETMVDQFVGEPDHPDTIEGEREAIEQAVSGEEKPYSKKLSAQNADALIDGMNGCKDKTELNDVIDDTRGIYERLTDADKISVRGARQQRIKALKLEAPAVASFVIERDGGAA